MAVVQSRATEAPGTLGPRALRRVGPTCHRHLRSWALSPETLLDGREGLAFSDPSVPSGWCLPTAGKGTAGWMNTKTIP